MQDDGIISRRKRTWYRRRLRTRRILGAVVVGVVLAVVGWQSVARHFSLPVFHASRILPDSFWIRSNIHNDLAFQAARAVTPKKAPAPAPAVYPYSVVPGGVKDASDLHYAALRDYVVRRHYAQFDFSQARAVRVAQPRQVYLSYRVRDTVFWTRRKVSLHLGELLLTDGKITARARCGNQISDTAKPEVSQEEPEADVFDRTVAALAPGPSFPIHPSLAPPELPAGQPTPPQLFANSFLFPYVPFGVPIPRGVCPPNDIVEEGHCHKKHRQPPIPEPPTMVLLATGLGFIAWRYKESRRPTTG